MENKSSRNKTIDFSEEEGALYLNDCIFEKDLPSKSIRLEDSIICGDTFSLLGRFEKEQFPLIIADPPYNISKQYNSSRFTATSNSKYKEYTRSWLDLTLPLLKKDGTMYICVDWKSSIILGEVLSEYEEQGIITIRNRITWEREKGRGAKANWKNCHEDIWYITKGENYIFNIDAVKMRRKVIAPYKENGQPKDWTDGKGGKYRDTCPSNFWNDITVPFWSMAENTAHPTQKPEKLLAKLILCSSNEGDLIFDPFGGSGSTAVTACKLGRHWCTIEKEKRFCAWALYRLQKAKEDKTIQGYEDGVFHQRNQ